MTKAGSRFSFSRAGRLDGPRAYAAVFALKCAVKGEYFQVYVRPNGALAARLGVVVSKRVMQRAIARNYCKRLVREAFRVERGTLSGLDFVVRPRTEVSRAKAVAARKELRDLLRRAQRLCRRREATQPH